MSLPIKNIFVDTNIYEENNFFHSTNIQSLFNYSQLGVINLHLTEISRLELEDRMKQHLENAKLEHNKLVNNVNKTRILKNLIEYEDIQKSKLKVDKALGELKTKWSNIIRTSRINIIPAANIDIDNIFRLHFLSEPPFSKKKDKHYEFKDAFILMTIESWCFRNKKRMIVISKDGDFDGYKSKRLVFQSSLPNLLERITEHYAAITNSTIIPKIKDSLLVNEQGILEAIDEKLNELIVLDVDFENTSPINISSSKFLDQQITSIRAEYAEVNYRVEIKYNFTIYPTLNDLNLTMFDAELKPIRISDKLVLTCDLEVSLRRRNHVELKWVNSNQKIRIGNKPFNQIKPEIEITY